MRCLFMSLALNLHQRHPPSVTSGSLFHCAIRYEITAPSSVLMGDGTRELLPSSVIPPRHAPRNGCTIFRFDGRWCSKDPSGSLFHRAIRREIAVPSFVLMAMVPRSYPRHPSFRHTIRREIAVPSFVLMGGGVRKLPPWGLYF